ncbi:9915_t:CDS:2, partial [Dentiscutata heterogama]
MTNLSSKPIYYIPCYITFPQVTLVQMVLISSSEGDYVLTPEDLPSPSPLLIYTATMVPDLYIPDNQDEDDTLISNNDSIEPSHVQPQNTKPNTK